MQTPATVSDPSLRKHRPKTLTVFAAAFAAGAVLAYGVNRVVDVHIVQVEPQVESEPIFVALRSLPQGSPITVWDVALKDWPKAMLPITALKADASLEGMVLRHPVREGQPLLSVQLVRDGAAGPTAVIAALPSAAQSGGQGPAATPAAASERFVPAAPAEPPMVPAAAVSIATPAESAAVEAVAVDSDAARTGATVPPAVDAPLVVNEPVQVADTDIDTPTVVPTPPNSIPDRTPPLTVAPTDPVAATQVNAGSGNAEPTLATADRDVVSPLAPPVPTLPTTDLGQTLTDVGRGRPAPVAAPASVLDRTNVGESPTPTRTTPRLHLVVPERIALAVDASFTQRPEQPAVQPAQSIEQPARGSAQITKQTQSTAVGRSPRSASQEKIRKPAPPARQPATKPTAKPTPAQSRGLGAWFPQLSASSRQR